MAGLSMQIGLILFGSVFTVESMNLFALGFVIMAFVTAYVSWQKFKRGHSEELLALSGWLLYGTLGALQALFYLGFLNSYALATDGVVYGLFFLMLGILFSALLRKQE